jgi:ectoine hydroxylase-related dioxygenase (phytanoyl-CoA dioxygenase family)
MQAQKIRTPARASYEENGFYLTPQPVIPPDIIARGIAGMDAVRRGEYDTGVAPQPSFWNPGDDPNKLCKIEMPQTASRDVMALVSHPAIGKLAAELTGAKWVQLWWVQLLYKPSATPTGAATIGWHQDFHYWQPTWDDDSQLFTAWVALTDVTEEAGPMKFVPGSHRWGLLDQSDFFGEFEKMKLEAPEGEESTHVSAVLPPGGVSFHDKLVFHGSGPNVSGAPRRSFAIHLRTEKSSPRDGVRKGLTEFIDNYDFCPVIYTE